MKIPNQWEFVKPGAKQAQKILQGPELSTAVGDNKNIFAWA